MKALTSLIIIPLITAIMPFDLKAQEKSIKRIEWNIAGEIPGNQKYASIGLAGAISGVSEGVLLVAGGTNFPDKMPWVGGMKHYYGQVYVYEKDLDANNLKLAKENFSLPFNLGYSAVCTTDRGIIVAGGENELGNSKKVMSLKWCPKNRLLTISNLPDLPFAVTNASLCVVDDVVYLAGGEVDGQTEALFLALNLKHSDSGWQKLTNLPQKTSHTVLLASSSKGKPEIFLIGGRKKNVSASSVIYNEVYAYNVKQNLWEPKQPLPYGVSAGSGISHGNELLVFSGDRGETFNKVENLILKIAAETDTNKLIGLNTEKANLLAAHPGFSAGVLRYNVKTNKWNSLNNLPPHPPVTTNAVLWGSEIFIAGGEIRAGVRSANIFSGQIKK